MLKRLKYLAAIFAIAVLLFEVNRVVFLIYYNDMAVGCSGSELFKAILYGLKLDVITAGYITILPLLATMVAIWLPVGERGCRIWSRVMMWYYAIITTLVAVIETADIGMFGDWQSRIDAQIMIYSPKEMMASVSLMNGISALLYIGVTLIVALYLFRYATRRWFHPQFNPTSPIKSLKPLHVRLTSTLVMLFVAASLFVVIRGGLSTATANVSKAYFSPKMFLNQLAVNPVFSFLSTLFDGDNLDEYNFYSEDEAIVVFEEAMTNDCNAEEVREDWLRVERPNVVLIILEGMGRTITDATDGGEAVAPNLLRLREEGIWFENLYASSFRTDRGTVAILSGFPAQPKMSIMKYPNRAAKLPGIARSLRDEGYATRFIYGGDANFTNTRAYLFATGFNEVADEREVSFGGHSSKWGAADNAVFAWAESAILSRMDGVTPTFDVILTLSSHEPFEVPYRRLSNDMLNAFAFTDDAVGTFVERLRQSKHWDNTLVVIIPDHGYPYPSTVGNNSPERHHIPMLWVGGAIREPMVIHDHIAQTDLAATLLSQLNIEHDDYVFSRDIASSRSSRFGYWTFNNGFGIIDSLGTTIYDHTSGMLLRDDCDTAHLRLRRGKAMLQRTFMEIKRL